VPQGRGAVAVAAKEGLRLDLGLGLGWASGRQLIGSSRQRRLLQGGRSEGFGRRREKEWGSAVGALVSGGG
jgi:hypothetical protein